MSEQPLLSLEDSILELEARLNRERTAYAENAFGIGLRAVALPVVLVIGLAFLLGARGWVTLFLVAASAILLAFILVSLFANQAQVNAARRIFREDIKPALQACQDDYQLSPEEVRNTAAAVLPADATLRTFLELPPLHAAPHPEEPPASPAGKS